MNTHLSTTRPTVRTARASAIAACVFVLFAGASACGTDDGTAVPTAAADSPHAAAPGQLGGQPAARIHQAPSSIDLIESARANQSAYLAMLMARQAGAGRHAHEYGDDRRQQQGRQPQHHARAHHAPGFDKVLLAQR
jgi:hypothetical protein